MADEKDLRKLWRDEEKKKRIQEQLDKERAIRAKDLESARSTQKDLPESADEILAQSDWQRLAAISSIKFPDHLAEKFNITQPQRLVAVAFCIGWTYEKIALASGLSARTVSRYLNEIEGVREFITAFQYHNGSVDSKELIDKEQYTSLEVLKSLRDDPSTSASTRKEIAIWFYEQKHGKAKESKEIKGINLRDLTEQLKKSKEDFALLTEEELDERSDQDPSESSN